MDAPGSPDRRHPSTSGCREWRYSELGPDDVAGFSVEARKEGNIAAINGSFPYLGLFWILSSEALQDGDYTSSQILEHCTSTQLVH